MNVTHEVFRIARAQTLIALCSTVPGYWFMPAWLRSTCHGISAATGKAGAIVGAFGFLDAAQSQDATKTLLEYPPDIGVKNSLIMLGVINFVGMLFTFLVSEPKGKSLGELSGETEVEK